MINPQAKFKDSIPISKIRILILETILFLHCLWVTVNIKHSLCCRRQSLFLISSLLKVGSVVPETPYKPKFIN